MTENFFLYFFFTIINFLLFYNYNFLANLINVFDKPDFKRKIHKEKTPLIGGLIFLISFLIISIFFFDKLNFILNFRFFSSTQIIIFIFFIFAIFFLGLLDDKIDIKAGQKIIYLFILVYFLISTNELFIIKSLRFESFNKEIDLFDFSIFFTVLSVVVFTNAMNMFDGINLHSSVYFLILYLFLTFFNFSVFNIYVIIFLIFFIFYNKSGKIFLGDSGVYLLSIFASISLIYIYNTKLLYVEDIFLLTFLPVLDLFRLFIVRIKNNKNPMIADRQHIHHIMLNKFKKEFLVVLLSSLFLILSLFLHFIINLNFLFIISALILLYYFLIKNI